MQIHVEVDAQNETRIKIFSKSRRESTWDRFATHWHVDLLTGMQSADNECSGSFVKHWVFLRKRKALFCGNGIRMPRGVV